MKNSSARSTVLWLLLMVSAATVLIAAPLSDPIRHSIPSFTMRTQLELVSTGLTAPNTGVAAPDNSTELFVTDQDGILWAIDLASGDKREFLDVSERVVLGGERGLLGVAFHPAYADNGLVYTYTSETAAGVTDFPSPANGPVDHHTVITEWQVPDPAALAASIDPGSAREILRIAQPQGNHNGGALAFGMDEHLYIALGDGGSADDQGAGHSPEGNGQDTGNVLGAILRIDPLGMNSANGQYSVPQDNPFFPENAAPFGGESGCADGICDEIFAYGFRNPFRLSFDKELGDLYVGDVGQNDIEEVDVVTAGDNYGWPIKEGSFCFDQNGSNPGFVTDAITCGPAGLVDPVAEYDHDEGSAVIGGFVYRGSRLVGLRGRYVFGDFLRNGVGRLFFLIRKDIVADDGIQTSRIIEMRLPEQMGLGLRLLGFGEDAAGELYVLGQTIDAAGDGVVYKLVRADTQ